MYEGVKYEFEGEMLSVKVIAGRVNLAPSTIYKYLKKGFTLEESISLGKEQSAKTFEQRTKTNNRTSKKYPYKDKGELTVAEICELEQISREPLYRRLKKGMSPEAAVIDIKKNIAPKFPYLGGRYSKWSLERLTGVSRFYLDNHIDDTKEYTADEIKKIIDGYKEQFICMYQGMSLYRYCVTMGYNYNVIYYSMKAYNLTPAEAVSQYVKFGQTARFAHRYALGDVLLYHFLLKMRIDDRYVTDRIRKGRSEEEAIVDAIFLNDENYKNVVTRNKLRAIYSEIESLENISMVQEIYGLSAEDTEFIKSKAYRSEEVLRQYRLFALVSQAQATGSTEELEMMLRSMNISMSELATIKDELLEGFVKISEVTPKDKIKYIWHRES